MIPPRELPVLFTDTMVRAVLEGRKTQTRRPVIFRDGHEPGGQLSAYGEKSSNGHLTETHDRLARCVYHSGWDWQTVHGWCKCRNATYACPFDAERLWVREAHHAGSGHAPDDYPYIFYRADGEARQHDGASVSPPYPTETPGSVLAGLKWTPSIHMSRWASRLTLEVERVWVERVQEISEADIRSEGTETPLPNGWRDAQKWRGAFRGLWDSIYAAKGLGWSDNPLVWCCEFRRVEK